MDIGLEQLANVIMGESRLVVNGIKLITCKQNRETQIFNLIQ